MAWEGFPLIWDGFAQEPEDRIGELFLGWVMSVVRHMLVDERRQSFDGVDVRAIRRQLNEVNAAVRPCEECPDIRSFRTGGVIPDDMDDNMPDDMPEDMDDVLVGVASPCPGEKLRGADPIDGRRFDKGTSKVSKLSAPWIFTRSRPAVVLTAGFEPFLTRPKAGLVCCSGCTASAKQTASSAPNPVIRGS